jgi:outer membrane protein TolC
MFRIVLLAGLCASASAQTPPALKSLMEDALRRNPEVLAAEKKLMASRQRPAQLASLPDPVLSAGYTSNGGPLPGQGLGVIPTAAIGFMVSQTLPAAGKLRLRRMIAQAEAEGVEREYWQAQLSVAARVKQAWHRLHHAWEQLALLERNQALLERILRVTEARYAVGKAAQVDVLKAQTQLLLLEARREKFEQEKRSREAELNALAVRPLDSAIERPPTMTAHEAGATLEQLYAAVKAASPILAREEKNVQRTELALNLARKDGSPDYTVSAGYFTMGRMPDMYQVRVDVPLPFFTRQRQRAAAGEQVHSLEMARRGYQAAGNTLMFRVKDDYLLSAASWRLLRLYSTTLIPQASLTLESSLPAYESGQVDFLTLLNNLTAVLEYEGAYHEEMLNYHLALLRLEELTGLELLPEDPQ